MPCNLAVSITKAAVTDEQLKKLLTTSVIHQVVKNFLNTHATYQGQLYEEWQTQECSIFYLQNCTITITPGGQISVNATRWSAQEAETVSADLMKLLARLADHLFAQQVQQMLSDLAPVESQVVTVDNDGISQQVTMLSLNL